MKTGAETRGRGDGVSEADYIDIVSVYPYVLKNMAEETESVNREERRADSDNLLEEFISSTLSRKCKNDTIGGSDENIQDHTEVRFQKRSFEHVTGSFLRYDEQNLPRS